MTFDIVMPTYNNVDQLRSALDSLQLSHYTDFRVLVCVDGSIDGSVGYLRSAPFPFRLEVLAHSDARNHGRSAARNLGIPHLESEFTLFLDSDMRLGPDALERHLEILRTGAVSIGDVTYEDAEGNPWARYLGTRGHHKAAHGERVRPLDFHTANTAVRTEDVLALGGFDESLTGYGGEDTEFGLRLARLRGRTLVFNARARAYTVETKTVDEGLLQLRRYAQTNLRAIRRKHPDGPAPFWIDRLESRRPLDRAFRLLLNPFTDRLVDALLPRAPWGLQRRLLSYKVIRTVFRGYVEGGA